MHHEGQVSVQFTNLEDGKFSFRMSRSSPRKNAIQEFIKDVYNVGGKNRNGEELAPKDQILINGIYSNMTVLSILPILFTDIGDRRYSQLDETHLHLNMPTTLMFNLANEYMPLKAKFEPRMDLG